jgi:hypothetical protein
MKDVIYLLGSMQVGQLKTLLRIMRIKIPDKIQWFFGGIGPVFPTLNERAGIGMQRVR